MRRPGMVTVTVVTIRDGWRWSPGSPRFSRPACSSQLAQWAKTAEIITRLLLGIVPIDTSHRVGVITRHPRRFLVTPCPRPLRTI
jgi:hypothetical protein